MTQLPLYRTATRAQSDVLRRTTRPQRRVEFGQLCCFTVSWIVIGLIAAYDTYLTVRFQDTLVFMERNPIGRWLIAVDDGSVALFVGAKVLGTIVVLGAILLLYSQRSRFGLIVSSGVAACQIGLLGYLTIA